MNSPDREPGDEPREPPGPPQEPPAEFWKTQLFKSTDPKTGQEKYAPILHNALMILSHDARHKGCWSLDTFSRRVMLRRDLAPISGRPAIKAPQPISKALVDLTVQVATVHNQVVFSQKMMDSAVRTVAGMYPHDVLTEHLDDLKWDGQPRLDTWLTRYLGAEETAYTRAVGRWWLISAMARAYIPGCKADHVLVLEGLQSSGKSTAAGMLAKTLGAEKLVSIRDYDRAAQSLQGTWMIEIAELDAFRGAAETQIKEFLSIRSDRYHYLYEPDHVQRPRRCVFIGSTNEPHYSRDATGARRFWGVKCGRLDRRALARDRDALLAEAREAFAGGGPDRCEACAASEPPDPRCDVHRWWPTEAMRDDLAEAQESLYHGDAWEARIAAWLDGHGNSEVDTDGPERDGLTTGEILRGALGIEPGKWGREEQTRVGQVLRRLRWEARQSREHSARVRRYYRPSPSPDQHPKVSEVPLDDGIGQVPLHGVE